LVLARSITGDLVAIWTRPTEVGTTSDVAVAELREQLAAARSDLLALTSNYERLRGALDASSAAVVVVDEQGDRLFDSLHALTEGDPGALLLLTRVIDGALGEVFDGVAGPIERAVELYGPARRNLVVTVELIRSPDRLIGAVAIVTNVTERQRLDALRRDFVTNVSHELRTPVGAMSVLAETLVGETQISSADPQTVARLARRMEEESRRLSRLVNDLLSLAHAEERGAGSEEISVGSVVSDALNRIESAAEISNVMLRVGTWNPSIRIAGDRSQLTSAVFNLLDNAVKYSREGSTVDVSVSFPVSQDGGRYVEGREYVSIEVTDTGVGIPMRDRERIFERFYRVDKARASDTGGTGLGLAIVRNVARSHGGEVVVKSIEGQGSTFTLLLPAEIAGGHA
jgi:two-component system, OmpR family, sensor histidine kinase SenX3